MPTICLDFDWVIHWYRKWWDNWQIYDEPVPWIKELISELNKNYCVVVYSTRCKTEEWRIAINEWLKKYDINVNLVAEEKPIAVAYVDDRAIRFDWDCNKVLEILKEKTWLWQ